jgi:hypothetical protein
LEPGPSDFYLLFHSLSLSPLFQDAILVITSTIFLSFFFLFFFIKPSEFFVLVSLFVVKACESLAPVFVESDGFLSFCYPFIIFIYFSFEPYKFSLKLHDYPASASFGQCKHYVNIFNWKLKY